MNVGIKTPSPTQLRAAMGMMGMDLRTFARAAGVNVDTLSRFCLGKHEPSDTIRAKFRRAVEMQGVEFTELDGVRRRPQDIEVFVGPERFHDFTEFVYAYLVEHGGDVCVSAGDETQFRQNRKDLSLYNERMKSLVGSGRVSVRVLATKSSFISSFAAMRRQAEGNAVPTAFYAFGNCLALISFDHTPAPYVVLHKSGPFAEAYRQSFNAAWKLSLDPDEQA